MKVVWIVLFAFTFAFLAQGRSLPSRNPKEANISPVFLSESVQLSPDGTTDDFTGNGLYANDKKSFHPPSREARKGNLDRKETRSQNQWINQLKDPKVRLQLDKILVHRLKSNPRLFDSFVKTSQHIASRPKSKPTQPHIKSEHHVRTPSNNEWGYGAPQDSGSDSEIDKLSPSDTDWSSGVPEDEEPESETDEQSPSDTEWGSGVPKDEEPKSITDEQSPSDTERGSGVPEDEETESETDNLSPSDTERGSGAPEDEEAESETDEQSPSDTEWDSGAPEDKEPESETDKPSPSDTERGSGSPEDEEPESETNDVSPEDTEWWYSGAPEDEKPDSETDELSPEDGEWDFGAPEDKQPESETDEISPSDTEWDSNAPEDEEPESETDELSPSDTEWGSGAPEDEETESETDKPSPSDTERGSGSPEDEKPDSETDELSPKDGEWDFGAPEDKQPESETDEISPSDTEWDSNAPEDKEPESETNELSPENAEWDSGVPDDKIPESETDDVSQEDTEWDSGALEDKIPESETDKLSPSDTELDSGAPEEEEPESDTDVHSFTDTEWVSGTPQGMESDLQHSESEGLRSRRSQRTPQGIPESEQLNIERKKGTLPLNVPDKGETLSITQRPSKSIKFGSGKENGFRQKISPSGSRLAGLSMAPGTNRAFNLNIQLDPNMFNKPGDNTKAEKKKKSEKQSSGAVVTVLTTLFVLGALLLVLLMTAFFVFAWPIRKYFEKLSKRMDSTDVESGRRDDYELTSIRVDKSHPPMSQPTPPYPPRQQEPTAANYQAPARRAVAGSGRNAVVANRQPGPSEVPQTEQNEATSDKKDIKTKADVINDDKKRDARNAERRKIIKQQTSQRRGSLADSIMVAKSVIDGHAKNKQFEKKASERRRVIKQCTSAAGASSGETKRCMSFAEELQTGRSVITPNSDHTKSVERSKERCRKIKEQCTGKRRQSLAEEIGVAKEVIVGSEKCEIPPAAVEERDSRNAERIKIIKQQTSQRRGSLADSIMIAKSAIDGHAKNKQFEKKASERRRVIKQCTSAPGSATGETKRCMSFAEELQTGRSVITPNSDHTKSVERSKERCRKIKEQCTGKRRQSLAEEIGVAKDVIVGSEKKCEIPPAVVEEVIVDQVPGNCKSYSDSDITELKYRCNQAATSDTTSYQDVNELDELRRGFTRFIFDSDEEANWNLI